MTSSGSAPDGHDWSGRFPWIVESALKNRHKQFVIDGEAVILGIDGIADFDALHFHQHDEEVQLYAFDILALDGGYLRKLPPVLVLQIQQTHMNAERLIVTMVSLVCRLRTGDGLMLGGYAEHLRGH